MSDGTYLWTYDMGPGIEPGIWYSPFIVYDFNGDGKAEVAIKTAGADLCEERERAAFAAGVNIFPYGRHDRTGDRPRGLPERKDRYRKSDSTES